MNTTALWAAYACIASGVLGTALGLYLIAKHLLSRRDAK